MRLLTILGVFKDVSCNKKSMKIFISILLITLLSNTVQSQTSPNHIWIEGYTRNDGTFVRGHYKTKSNSTTNDNFTTYGNINPYTQEPGWISREKEMLEYDPYLNYKIPETYVYSTIRECQLEIVNTMNMWTLDLNKHLANELDRPFWSVSDSILYTELDMDVWEVDEKEISQEIIKLYFTEIEINSKRKGLIKLLSSIGLNRCVIRTPNHEFELNLSSLI